MLARVALGGAILALALTGEAWAAFPGLNGKIAFESNVGGGPDEIYTVEPDGSGLTNVTNAAGDDTRPAYSADGSRIAFRSNRDGNTEIYVMNADGSGQTRLTNDPGSDEDAQFSPDGSKIVFETDRDGNSEIYVMNADGSSPTNLSKNSAADFNPVFSPDGSKIAFGTNRDAGNIEIYVMNADGSGPTNVSLDPAIDNNPNFSPDGSKIVFDTDRTGNSEIYVMSAGGSAQTNLTKNPADDRDPVFSPDGSKVAFDTGRDPTHEIYVMNADGSEPTDVSKTSGFDEKVAWQGGDFDSDGVGNPTDNCLNVANPDQADLDGDKAGDACDADDDGDGVPDAAEAQLGSNPRAADTDGDGKPDGLDACLKLAAATQDGCPVIPVIPDLTDPVFVVAGVPRKMTAKKLLASGIRPALTPDRPVSFLIQLLAPVRKLGAAKVGDLLLAERRLALGPGTRRARLKVARKLRAAVRRGRKLQLRVTATAETSRVATRTRTIKVR